MNIDNFKLAYQERRKTESLREMAAGSGVSTSTLSLFDRGIGTPEAETLARLSSYLDVPLSSGVVVSYVDDTLKAIKNVIDSDDTLTLMARCGLFELISTAYDHMLKNGG